MALSIRGGIVPPRSRKSDDSFIELPVPDQLMISLPVGYTACVSCGQTLARDTVLAKHEDGSVLCAPLGSLVLSLSSDRIILVPIEESGESRPLCDDIQQADADFIISQIQKFGLMTEQGIPLWKMLLALRGQAELFVVNMVECEPGVTSVRSMLAAYANKIAGGMKILMKALALGRAVVAINESLQAKQSLLQKEFRKKDMVSFVTVANRYPLENPKVLFQALTGAACAPSSRKSVLLSPADCIAVYDLFATSHTPSQRVVTVAEQNYLVYLGTPLSSLALLVGKSSDVPSYFGGYISAQKAPMDAAISPCTKAVQYLEELDHRAGVCLDCGRCMAHCPIGLAPSLVAFQTKNTGKYDHMRSACIECGVCDAVCPVDIPLRRMIREGGANES